MPRFPDSLPANPTKAQRKAHAAAFAVWAAEFAVWAAEEANRVRLQRAAFAANLGPARAELQRIMLDRAWALLEMGECEAADALLEFVPEKLATALLDEYFDEPFDGPALPLP